MKRVKYFMFGFLFCMMLTPLTIYASSVLDIILNEAAVVIDGKVFIEAQTDLQLSNGTRVPSSINYEGTTYLPLRKISEALGFQVSYDADTAQIDIVSETSVALQKQSPSRAVTSLQSSPYVASGTNQIEAEIAESVAPPRFESFSTYFFRINGKLCDLKPESSTSLYLPIVIREEDGLMVTKAKSMSLILGIMGNQFSFSSSENPFVDSSITVLNSYPYSKNETYVSLTEKEHSIFIAEKGTDKKYFINNEHEMVEIDDVLTFFGFDKSRIGFEIDEKNKCVIIEFYGEYYSDYLERLQGISFLGSFSSYNIAETAYVHRDIVFMPIRSAAELLELIKLDEKIQVKWNDAKAEVIIGSGDAEFRANVEEYDHSSPESIRAFIKEGRSYVNLNLIFEFFDIPVSWIKIETDSTGNKTVTIGE